MRREAKKQELGFVGQSLLAVPHSLSWTKEDSQEWLSY
jgi:hypothetical protein